MLFERPAAPYTMPAACLPAYLACSALPACQIIIGELLPDSGEIIKARENMSIAYLTQVGRLCRGGACLL